MATWPRIDRSSFADASKNVSTTETTVVETVATVAAPAAHQLRRASHGRSEQSRLKTPPVPPDLPQWGVDGRFRPADSVGTEAMHDADAISSRDQLVSDAAPGFKKEIFDSSIIFGSVEEEDSQRRKSVAKAALRELSTLAPHLLTHETIRVAADATDQFLRAHRDEPLRFPLDPKLRAELAEQLRLSLGQQHTGASETAVPPAVASRRMKQADVAAEAVYLAAFNEVRESYRLRLNRFFGRYDPSRMREVDRLLADAAKRGVAGAEEDLLQSLIRLYGPEPAAHEDQAPVVVICTPQTDSSGVIRFFASLQGEKTDVASWSLSTGNLVSSTPLGLDTLAQLGVAQTTVVSESPLGEFDRALTLSLELLPGSVRTGMQYTVHLSLLGRGGVKAKDSMTFFVDAV